jgi:hypothetical protein
MVLGRRGGLMVARQTVVLQSRVQIWRLPSPQLTAILLVGCHLGWHLAAGWPLWGATEKKIMKMNLWFTRNINRKKKENFSPPRSHAASHQSILHDIVPTSLAHPLTHSLDRTPSTPITYYVKICNAGKDDIGTSERFLAQHVYYQKWETTYHASVNKGLLKECFVTRSA